MHTRTASILLGALLSTGMIMAQDTQAPSATPPSAQAEGHGHKHAMNPDKQANHLAKKLNLSSDQVAQIKPILADRQQQMQSLRADTSMAQADRRAKARSIQQDSRTKIEAVLNDTQKQQFEQMQANRRAHHQKGALNQATPQG